MGETIEVIVVEWGYNMITVTPRYVGEGRLTFTPINIQGPSLEINGMWRGFGYVGDGGQLEYFYRPV